MAAAKKGVSPAQTQRDSLTSEVQARGRKAANIWLVWSAINDADVVLVGDLKAEHFFACEGDPNVVAVTYNPDPIEFAVGNKIEPLQFDAKVTLQDNTTEWRVIHPKRGHVDLLRLAAENSAAKYVHVTPAYLEPLSQRARNWRRALRALFCCKSRTIAHLENAVDLYLRRHGEASLGDVLANLNRGNDAPLLLAAVVRLLSKRIINSDLDLHHFSLRTKVSAKEAIRDGA